MKTTHLITVNNRDITIVTDKNEKYVSIKSICKAIGVKYDTQIDKINADEILSQLTPLRGATGADGKEYKMRVIPLKYVFGWLFTISANKVKPEIKESIIAYKKECYDALFDTFTKRTNILKEKTTIQVEIEKLESDWKNTPEYKKIQELKKQQSDATKRLNNLDKNIVSEQLDLFKSNN
jgi:hypothetical protein